MPEDLKPQLTYPSGVPFVPGRSRQALSPLGALTPMQVTRVQQLIAAAVAPIVAQNVALTAAVKALGGTVPEVKVTATVPAAPTAKKKVAMPRVRKGKAAPVPPVTTPAANDPSDPPANTGRAPSADGKPAAEYPAEIQAVLDACPAEKTDLKKALRSIADLGVPVTVRVTKMKALFQNS